MAGLISIFRKFEDISLGKKVGLALVLLVVMCGIIAAIGLFYLWQINATTNKVKLSYKINDNISQARYTRAMYMGTYDILYMKENREDISDIVSLLTDKANTLWSDTENSQINKILELIKEYTDVRDDIVKQIAIKTKAGEGLGFIEVEKNIDLLEKKLKSENPTNDYSLPLLQLRQNLTNLRYQTARLLVTVSDENEKSLSTAIDTAINSVNAINSYLTPDQKILLEPVYSQLKTSKEQLVNYIQIYQKELLLAKNMEDISGNISKLADELLDWSLNSTHEGIYTAGIQIAVALLVAIFLAFVIAWRIRYRLVTPLRTILNIAERIATGDLRSTMTVQHTDELGLLMNAMAKMNGNLRNMINNIQIGVSNVSHDAKEIAAGNNNLSVRTEQQAAAVEETAASMEQINATVKQNADNAHHANQLATSASQTAQKGGELVNDVVSTMNDISNSSRRIAEITHVINDIAFQTNILALNAAVEAARAGEQGRGFAVVASEVRSLAQRSAQAAREIEDLITESVTKVNNGTTLVQNAGHTMEDIVRSVSHLRDIMAEIASASDEQSKGIAQVSQAVVELDSTTQQNAALVEQSASAASSLAEQAILLAQTVDVFRLSESDEPQEGNGLGMPSYKQTTDKKTAVEVPKNKPKVDDLDNWETF